MPKPCNRKLVAVLYDGLCTFEFGLTTELFGLERPELDVDWYDYGVVSVDPGPLSTLGGVTVSAPTDLSVIETAGTIVLPGWRDPGERPPERLISALRVAHSRGARLLSICSGVFVLAATGLLDGQAATTHWRYTDQLQADFPAIDVRPGVLYVDNGQTLTSAGSAAGLDLGLHLIRRDYGAAVANQVARRLVVPPHRDGGQAQFIVAPVQAIAGPALATTIDWALNNLDRALTVAKLASHANMTPRTFARRFGAEVGQPPHQWLSRQRVLRAQELLETTNVSIDVVAQQSGLGSAANLRHHFERETQTTPTRYRAVFSDAERGESDHTAARHRQTV